MELGYIVNKELPVKIVGDGAPLLVSSEENFVKTKNLFNKSLSVANSYIKNDGTSTNGANVGWRHSDYIPVVGGKKIALSTVPSSNSAGTAFYNGTTFISFVSNTTLNSTNGVVTVPANATAMRATIYDSLVDTFQIEYGTERTAFEAYFEPKPMARIFNDFVNKESQDGKFVTIRKDAITLPNYEKFIEKDKYNIWKYKQDGSNYIKGIYRNVAVRGRNNDIEISTKGINGSYDYKVTLDSATFPGLIADSRVSTILVLPWQRNRKSTLTAGTWRLVVITTKGQIYHNFPSRGVNSDGEEVAGDIIRFEQSVVWDIKGRKYPSKNPTASGVETYFPGLPDTAYEYHPRLNTDAGFVDTYGNGGFGKSKTNPQRNELSRFYEPGRYSVDEHSFMFMGGYEPGEKISIIGTYCENATEGSGTRMCVFATDDGGRSWYNKFEFAGGSNYKNWRANINTINVVGNYTAESFVVKKRDLVLPNATNKEPATMFNFGSGVVVSNITKAHPAVVTTKTPHGLKSGDVVIFQNNASNSGTSADWDWLRNDTANENSGGNGKMFKVKELNSSTFSIHEYVASPFHNIPCRHIHHVNAIKDGWLVGTGEIYPDGWSYFLQLKEGTTFDGFKASAELPAYRLNSTDTSVQRTLGSILYDDKDATFLVASDSYVLPRQEIAIEGRSNLHFTRATSGVYRGKLSDIDNFDSKFECIFESVQTAYFFKEKNGVIIFIGRQGEIGISFDKGNTWHREQTPLFAQKLFFGEANNLIAVNDLIIEFKK